MRTFSLRLLPALLLFSASAFSSENPIQFIRVNATGAGCPNGASFSLSPDGRAISILFDQMVAEVGPASGLHNEAKPCKVRIPLRNPAGHGTARFVADYRGYRNLESGTSASFKMRTSLIDSIKTRRSNIKLWNDSAPSDGPTHHRFGKNFQWVKHAGEGNLILVLDLMIRAGSNSNFDSAYRALDSVDVSVTSQSNP